MFDFVQEKKRYVYVILILMVLPFAFFGVDSYRHAGSGDAPAVVNGTKISAQELENGVRQQQEQLRQRMGAGFDPAMFDTPAMQHAVLDGLVSQRLLADRAKAAGLTVTDEQIAQLIGSIEAFQDNGKFDKKRYETVLANNNLTPLMYEGRVRDELLRQQLSEAYLQNGYLAQTSVDKIIRLNEQQRVISVAPVAMQPLLAQVKIDASAIQKYYEQNAKAFSLPEQARVAYVKFSPESLFAKVDVAADEVHKFYDEHATEFGRAEQRQVSHILIGVAATAPQAEQDAAKSKAEKVLAELKQTPAKFAALARQYSQDPGSASKGGDLGVFGRGMMVKPFEDAAFTLKQGELSGLVKSDFGYHLIKVTAIQAARVQPFEEVKAAITMRLRQQKAAEKFTELAEKFSNTVYEQSDTLKPAAELIGAKVEQSDWLSKDLPSAPLWNAKSLQAVFSEDVLKNKRNTAAVEVAPSTLVAARLIEYKPASVRPLAEVQAVIQQKLVAEQAAILAAQQGKAELDALQKTGKTHLLWSASQSITRGQHGSLDMALVRQIFQANSEKLPQYVGAESAQGGYVVVRVDAVRDGAQADENKHGRYAQQLRQILGDELFQAYLSDAKSHASIKVNLPANLAVKTE